EALDDPQAVVSAVFAASADPGRALQKALERCGARIAPQYTLGAVAESDWVRRSQAHFAPLRVGRLWLGASWHVAPADCACVLLDPGCAFGLGSHASTRLLLGYLDHFVHGREPLLD